jgi:hypothetical protein
MGIVKVTIEVEFAMSDRQAKDLKYPLGLDAFVRKNFGQWEYSKVLAEEVDQERRDIKNRLARTNDEDLLDDAMDMRNGW